MNKGKRLIRDELNYISANGIVGRSLFLQKAQISSDALGSPAPGIFVILEESGRGFLVNACHVTACWEAQIEEEKLTHECPVSAGKFPVKAEGRGSFNKKRNKVAGNSNRVFCLLCWIEKRASFYTATSSALSWRR